MGRSENFSMHPEVGLPPSQSKEVDILSRPPVGATTGDALRLVALAGDPRSRDNGAGLRTEDSVSRLPFYPSSVLPDLQIVRVGRPALAEAGAGARTDAGAGARTEAGAGARTDAGAGARTEAGVGARTDAGAGARTDAGVGARTDAGTRARAGAGAGAGAGAEVRDRNPEAAQSEALVQRFGNNVELDAKHQIAKITYPAEGKTREFGRDENGEINKLVTTTPRGQFSYVKENGQWLYVAPDSKKYFAPDFSLDNNGEFSKKVRDGVVLTQGVDGRSFEEERTAIGARIQRDADGHPLSIKRPDNTMITATYEDGRLTKLVDTSEGQSTTWQPDAKGHWRSDDVPPETVRNMRVDDNGNLSYTHDKVKYTIRGNGDEIQEKAGSARYSFDDEGRISKIKYPGNKSALSFGYMGGDDKPSFIQVDDYEKHTSKRYIHQPEKGGWTELDRNNNLLGTWKGSVKINGDGSYAVRPLDGDRITYLQDGTTRTEKTQRPVAPDQRPQDPEQHRQHPEQRQQDPSERRSPSDNRTTPRPSDAPSDVPNEQRPADPNSVNEITDHSVQLRGYMLPSPDQLGAGSCLYMSATGIGEYLINKSKGIVNPQVGGTTDLSEQWTINLSKTVQLGNNYTDAPELLAKAGALPDSRMKFKAYGSCSWMNEPAVGGRGTEALPPYKKDVLFNGGGEGSQNAHGQMRPADLERIKKYLRENQSPVLFVYKPPTANWWHANIITGYNDKTQTFTVRDSSFGRQVTDAPAYNYDGRSPWGARPYRDQTEMPYYQVLQWGNHATGYRLAGS